MKILISTPCYNSQLTCDMANSLLLEGVELKSKNHSFNWHTPVSSVLSYSRNLACKLAIEQEYDWLLFWDGDISVNELGFIDKMIEEGFKNQSLVIGLPVALKGEPRTYNFANKIDDKFVNGTELPTESTFVDVIGTGVMLINVNILKTTQPPYFSFTDTWNNDQPGFWPEDWGFCEKTSDLTKILMVPIKTSHRGTAQFT